MRFRDEASFRVQGSYRRSTGVSLDVSIGQKTQNMQAARTLIGFLKVLVRRLERWNGQNPVP